MNVCRYVTSGLPTIDRAAFVWNLVAAVVVLVDDKRAGRAGTASPVAGSPTDSTRHVVLLLLGVGSVHCDW